jgi:hypothetical protein
MVAARLSGDHPHPPVSHTVQADADGLHRVGGWGVRGVGLQGAFDEESVQEAPPNGKGFDAVLISVGDGARPGEKNRRKKVGA